MDYRQRKGMAPCLPGERFYMGHVIINSLKNHDNINYKLPGWSSVPLETEDWEHWRLQTWITAFAYIGKHFSNTLWRKVLLNRTGV